MDAGWLDPTLIQAMAGVRAEATRVPQASGRQASGNTGVTLHTATLWLSL